MVDAIGFAETIAKVDQIEERQIDEALERLDNPSQQKVSSRGTQTSDEVNRFPLAPRSIFGAAASVTKALRGPNKLLAMPLTS